MAENMFDYFYNHEAEQFAFYRIPKALFTDDYFRDLSSDAKILYGLMLDRLSLSINKEWVDEDNRAYIIFTLEQVMEYMNCGKDKGVKILAELDTEKGIGLIERVRQGQGKPTLIYVKKFRPKAEVQNMGEEAVQTSEKPKSRLLKNRSQEFGKVEVKTSEKPKSRLLENRSKDFGKSDPIKTENNKTENNYNNIYNIYPSIHPSSIHPSICPAEFQDTLSASSTENVCLDFPDILDEPEPLVNLVKNVFFDILSSQEKVISVNGKLCPAENVKAVYRTLREAHFRQVINYIKSHPVSNLNAITTALYNSPKYVVLENYGDTLEKQKEKKQSKFNNFHQRDYDYSELEKMLLGGGASNE